MIRSFTSRSLLLMAVALLPMAAAAQGDLAARLSSRFADERARATMEVARLSLADVRALLENRNPRVRSCAAAALAGRRDAATVTLLLELSLTESDPEVRLPAATSLWHVVVDAGLDINAFDVAPSDELSRAAAAFVHRRISRLTTTGTTWTDHAATSCFAPMGSWGEAALRSIVADDDVRLAIRCFAAICLGRVDSIGFWVDDAGAPSEEFCGLLTNSSPALQMALLYAAAARGLHSRGLHEAVARFAREEAFGEEIIQAALHLLYTLDSADIEAATSATKKCVADFVDVFHSQLVRYNGGQLFKRLQAPELIPHVFEVLKDDPGLAGYWLFVGLMENVKHLPEASRESTTREILDWALSEANDVPQIRGLAAWHCRERTGSLPDGVDLDSLLAEIRTSVATLHPLPVDPDNYAQRAGVDILAHLGDPKGAEVIRPLLGHHNEAVRMAAAMAAGNGGYAELADDLAVLAGKKLEYASFGAAFGLMKLGDERAVDAFVDIIGCGNAVLARPSLVNLRSITKDVIATNEPSTPTAWRRRAAAWREKLAGNTAPQR